MRRWNSTLTSSERSDDAQDALPQLPSRTTHSCGDSFSELPCCVSTSSLESSDSTCGSHVSSGESNGAGSCPIPSVPPPVVAPVDPLESKQRTWSEDICGLNMTVVTPTMSAPLGSNQRTWSDDIYDLNMAKCLPLKPPKRRISITMPESGMLMKELNREMAASLLDTDLNLLE